VTTTTLAQDVLIQPKQVNEIVEEHEDIIYPILRVCVL
jgi:hypothetical protein